MKGKIEVILVDIGNTRIKSAAVVDRVIGKINTHTSTEELMQSYPDETKFMACSTRSEKPYLQRMTLLDHTTSLPIRLDYNTPETLGMDRVAAAVGAYDLFPESNSLVIDMGTCITMDLVSKSGLFIGGIISPGLKMRMKTMAKNTAKLPDISENWDELKVRTMGKSTRECLLAGSYGGIINEIEGILSKLSQDFTSINVILTGGDAHYFESKLKAHIFAGSKIVLSGLYRIWKDLQ